MVGFNRRFAPHIQKIKTLLAGIASPISMSITVNVKAAPEHWTQDKAVGGGRILGECCHFIDLCRYLQGIQSSIGLAVLESPDKRYGFGMS